MTQANNYTQQCPNCGEINDTDHAICINCQTPLTAYGGQVGQQENFTGNLAAHVEALEIRPPVVVAMTVFNVLFALAVPFWTVIAAWTTRPHINTDDTTGIGAASSSFSAAAGTFAAILKTGLLVPAGIALCVIAFFTWTQRTWAWAANAIVLGVVALLPFLLHGFSITTFIWIALAGGFAYFWFQPQVKAWFGLD